MEPDEYLKSVLESQTLADDNQEMKDLRERRDEIESHLRKEFEGSSPTIRYGGSVAKNTLIKEFYDLDLPCYFTHDDIKAGKTLEEIFNNTKDALKRKYGVLAKTSSIRVLGAGDVDFHVDVVPGRFTDDSKGDCYLHQASGKKERLKTNLDVHISHIKGSGLTEPIRLNKLWRTRNSIGIRTFPLELVTIELLKNKKEHGLSKQLVHAWTEMRDNVDAIAIKDPANPTGNDLSDLFSQDVRTELSNVAKSTLKTLDQSGWEAVFGPIAKDKSERRESLKRAAERTPAQIRPYCPRA